MTPDPASGLAPGRSLMLRTLGGAGLYVGDAGDPLLGPGKPLAILIYLCLTPGRRTSREFLMDLLWADLDPDRARRTLRQALFHLRRLLGEDAIGGTEELTLHRAIEVDRDRFLAAIEEGEVEGALELYRGPFLPSFGVPGGAAFEHWADLERDRMQSAFLRSAELLVRRRLNQSLFRDAQRLARQVRDMVPGDEAAWRLLLETVVAGRDFVSAAVEADALEQWAGREGTTLEPATRGAMARARRLTPASEDEPEGFGLVAELIGREREFFAITSAWEAARGGPARHLHLTAPAGFGKSRLLRDACARLAAAGTPVARVQGTPGDRDVPYALAGDLALRLADLPGATGVAPASAATLIALNPALSARMAGAADSSQGEEALRRRIHALTDLVHSVAHEQPFVLAIDDLHWIDLPSYRVLEGLWSRLEKAHVLCLTAARPERHPGGPGCTALPLAPLSPGQVASLVSALGVIPAGEAWSGGFVGGVHGATRGSPLLVLETLRLALDQGILSLERNEWRCLDRDRLGSLLQAGEALRERVRSLPGRQVRVLALLAVAGIPLESESLGLATQSGAELPALLAPLEQLGLVTRTGAGWVPTHDEVAAAALAALTGQQRTEAECAIGELHARARDADSHRLLRAARHFLVAGDEPAVQRLHRRYALLSRERGDRRPFAQLAAELVGEEPHTSRVRGLVGSLPRRWRLGLWSRPRQAAALAAGLLLPSLALAGARARSVSEATLQRVVFADSAGNTTILPVRPEQWGGSSASLRPARGASSLASAAVGYPELPPAISPDGRSAAWIQKSGDSTTLDVWIRTPSGLRRLTREPRDDLVHGWLPDGSGLIGATNRWSPPGDGDYDIAVYDTATGIAKQLTRGPAHDTNPFVSPDGTRIAFGRVTEDEPPMVCVTTFDGRQEPECRLIGEDPLAALLGWIGRVELAVVADGQGTRELVKFDWLRNVRTTLLGPHVYRGRLSPDRRWLAAALRLEGIRGFRDWVIPVGDPGKARPVGEPGGDPPEVRWWEGRPDRSLLIDRIEFSDSAREILPGIGTRLRIRPLTASGEEVPVWAPVWWHSNDTLVATVDSTGEVKPRTAGSVTISASLGGWRSTRKTIRVAGVPPATVLEERWDERWKARWLPWGSPHPTVSAGPGGVRGFENRGDGTYYSLALLRQPLSARQGLGVEIRLSTPVTRTKWQRMRIALAAGIDPAAFDAADQGAAHPPVGRAGAICDVTFPGEGRWGATRIGIQSGIATLIDLGGAAGELRSGAWWTLRLQILPDGRCGVAINGRVIWLSPEPMPLEGEYRLRLGDESAGTRILHGPLQVWTGVKTDLDWSIPARHP